MVIPKPLHPGNGIGDRLLDAGVLPVELAMGLPVAVDQASAAQRWIAGEPLHGCPSWLTSLVGLSGQDCIRSGVTVEIGFPGGRRYGVLPRCSPALRRPSDLGSERCPVPSFARATPRPAADSRRLAAVS
jgi:hypothetical protein